MGAKLHSRVVHMVARLLVDIVSSKQNASQTYNLCYVYQTDDPSQHLQNKGFNVRV